LIQNAPGVDAVYQDAFDDVATKDVRMLYRAGGDKVEMGWVYVDGPGC
jgi:hypothetical protein